MYSIDRDFLMNAWEDDEDGTARLKIEQLGMSYKPRLHRRNKRNEFRWSITLIL